MRNSAQLIDAVVTESIRVKTLFFGEHREAIAEVVTTITNAIRNGRKVLFFGNGGSAADAQHFAAEFVGRFLPDRAALPGISLSTDTSIITAIGNDYGYERIFSRQIEALGHPGDIAIAISTSGNSPNVIEAVDLAHAKGLFTVGFSGETGGKMKDRVDVLFRVPSRMTQRIQETHQMLGHIICELVDRELFPDSYTKD